MKKQKSPILILDASNQPYLSLGRHFGGVKAFGSSYIYVAKEDAFVRDDWIKVYKKNSWEEFVALVESAK